MKHSDKNNDVLEAVQELATHMDKQFEATNKKIIQVEKSVGKLRSDMITHVQRQVSKAQSETVRILTKEIRTAKERSKLFDLKILSIFERTKLANPEEIAALKELVV